MLATTHPVLLAQLQSLLFPIVGYILRLKQIANQSSSSCSYLGHLHRICLSLLLTVAYPSSLPNLPANEIRGDVKVKYCSSFHLLQSLCPLRLLPGILFNCQTYVTVAGGLLCSELNGEKKFNFCASIKYSVKIIVTDDGCLCCAERFQ